MLAYCPGVTLHDWLRQRNPSGRILVVMFGIVAPIIPIWIGFTTESAVLFYVMNFLAGMFAATALGAAAATTQDLVLPRMRGTATATFFLATTLFGLALGPYLAGQMSVISGSLSTGVLSILVIVPVGIALLLFSVQRHQPLSARQRIWMYRFIEFIGRWSMLDIFVIAFLVAVVNFGRIASVEANLGAVAFASVVILTMLAALTFDPRLIWDNTESDDDHE